MKNIGIVIAALVGGCVGFISAFLGYTITTWQYWVVIIIFGIIGGMFYMSFNRR